MRGLFILDAGVVYYDLLCDKSEVFLCDRDTIYKEVSYGVEEDKACSKSKGGNDKKGSCIHCS